MCDASGGSAENGAAAKYRWEMMKSSPITESRMEGRTTVKVGSAQKEERHERERRRRRRRRRRAENMRQRV